MSSVVGIDLGTLKTVIAVARNRGVDVITNEVSNRSTPSLVGFGPKSRYLGETAKTQEITNLKNTISSLKRLAGRSFNDPDIQIEQQFISASLVDVNGEVGAEVMYRGEKQRFTATQLVAMYLNKIKQIAANELKATVSDIVMSVPAWFTDVQRRAVVDATEIAGLKLLRLINDTTAAALGYGITKLDLPTGDEAPRRVVFVDFGHSEYTVSVVEFRKGELSVKATTYDRHLGGRDFDKALFDRLANEFKAKYSLDVLSHPRAKARVLASVEKVKKVLSANQQAPINIESLMNDIDVSSMITRQDFEEMAEPLLARLDDPLERALADAKLTKDDINFIEVIGGASRIPAVKERIQNFFGKTLSFTCNQDEAVARGCAFSCAILSPAFRVRDFSVHDIINYPIEFTWEKATEIPEEDTSLTIFNKGNVMPSTKILTFYRKQPFDLEVQYANPEELPGSIKPWIGRFSIKGIKPSETNDFIVCKIKARVNINGILNIEHAYHVEDVEVEEEVKEEKPEGENSDAMETDGAKKTRIVKRQVRKGDLPVVSGLPSLSEASKATLFEQEAFMSTEDKLVADTEEKKNELETFIYELRAKLDDQYADLASEEEKEKIRAKLMESEDWLYDEGEDTTKSVYVAKIDEIRAIAGPLVQRHFEKVEAHRRAVEERLAAETAARKAAEETRLAAEATAAANAAANASNGNKDEEMTDANTPKAQESESK